MSRDPDKDKVVPLNPAPKGAAGPAPKGAAGPAPKGAAGPAPKGAAGKAKPCPLCGRPVDPRFRPFCSKRCAEIDLGQWLGEGYRVPGEKAPPRDDDGGAEEDDETP